MVIGSIVRLLWPLPNFTEAMTWTGKTSVAGVNTNDNRGRGWGVEAGGGGG